MMSAAELHLERVGVLLNPGGGRLRKSKEEISTLAKALPRAIYREASNPEETRNVLADFASIGIDLLVVVAGDGTFHLVLSIVIGEKRFSRMPRFALVPAGTTNMSARDFEAPDSPQTALRNLHDILQLNRAPTCLIKPVLCLQHGDERPHYGMFFGAGLIAEAVEHFASRVRGSGVTGEKASALVFIRYLLTLLLGIHAGERDSAKLTVQLDESEVIDESNLLIFASSLDRLLFGLRPYWGRQNAPIHSTLIRQRPSMLWFRALPLLFGRGNLSRSAGYFSKNTFELKMTFSGIYVIDGEVYRADKNKGAVFITANDNIEIVNLKISK